MSWNHLGEFSKKYICWCEPCIQYHVVGTPQPHGQFCHVIPSPNSDRKIEPNNKTAAKLSWLSNFQQVENLRICYYMKDNTMTGNMQSDTGVFCLSSAFQLYKPGKITDPLCASVFSFT